METEHTSGKLVLWKVGTKNDPSFALAVLGGDILFETLGGNDKANAERLLKCWSSHDELLAACEAWERAVKHGSLAAYDLGSKMLLVGTAIELTKAAISEAKGGDRITKE